MISKSPIEKLKLLYDNYYDEMISYGLTLGVGLETVEDAIHDVFINIYKYTCRNGIHFYELDRDSQRFFLMRCLKNRIVSILRLRDNQIAQLSDEICPEDTAAYNTEYEALLLEIENTLPFLNNHQRKAVQLRFYSNLSFKEIAEQLGINTKGAQKLVYRAIASLRQKIKK